jgi:GT2 family glycosyltransferase
MRASHQESPSGPPPDTTGRPSDEQAPPPSPCAPNGTRWPRISIITPSFNQAAFLEHTIRSVLEQRYPNLEYIIIDGGSTDGSVEIIRKYETHLAYWTSEKDRGQTHAINKGLQRATGEIIAYLNSDDMHLPGALKCVAGHFLANPDVDLIHGRCRVVDVHGKRTGERMGDITRYVEILDLWDVWWNQRNFVQPEVFWTRRIMDKIGPFQEELVWVMDYEYWARILRAGGRVESVRAELAAFRVQPNQKSAQSEKSALELLNVVRPLLWEKPSRLRFGERVTLQGKWIFDALFRREASRLAAEGHGRMGRWLRLFPLAMRHPQIFAVTMFWRRCRNTLRVPCGN